MLPSTCLWFVESDLNRRVRSNVFVRKLIAFVGSQSVRAHIDMNYLTAWQYYVFYGLVLS